MIFLFQGTYVLVWHNCVLCFTQGPSSSTWHSVYACVCVSVNLLTYNKSQADVQQKQTRYYWWCGEMSAFLQEELVQFPLCSLLVQIAWKIELIYICWSKDFVMHFLTKFSKMAGHISSVLWNVDKSWKEAKRSRWMIAKKQRCKVLGVLVAAGLRQVREPTASGPLEPPCGRSVLQSLVVGLQLFQGHMASGLLCFVGVVGWSGSPGSNLPSAGIGVALLLSPVLLSNKLSLVSQSVTHTHTHKRLFIVNIVC